MIEHTDGSGTNGRQLIGSANATSFTRTIRERRRGSKETKEHKRMMMERRNSYSLATIDGKVQTIPVITCQERHDMTRHECIRIGIYMTHGVEEHDYRTLVKKSGSARISTKNSSLCGHKCSV